MGKLYEEKEFKSVEDNRSFNLIHTKVPDVNLTDNKEKLELTDESNKVINNYFNELSNSELNKGGIGVIFGTFDNLHIGHSFMLNTAKNLCSELYIGVEDQKVALKRKKNKHPILPNEQRIEDLSNKGFAKKDNIFVRDNALLDVKRIRLKKGKITTLFVGITQCDNPEVVDVVEYAKSNNMDIVTIPRINPRDKSRQISSSTIHKLGLAKDGRGQK